MENCSGRPSSRTSTRGGRKSRRASNSVRYLDAADANRQIKGVARRRISAMYPAARQAFSPTPVPQEARAPARASLGSTRARVSLSLWPTGRSRRVGARLCRSIQIRGHHSRLRRRLARLPELV